MKCALELREVMVGPTELRDSQVRDLPNKPAPTIALKIIKHDIAYLHGERSSTQRVHSPLQHPKHSRVCVEQVRRVDRTG